MFKTYRNLKSLHSLYEQNFVLINKLSGELDKHNEFSFQVGNLEIKSQVSISKKQLSKFTDEEVENVQLSKGDRVFFMYSGANRDPRAFSQPEIFDITRDTSPSLAFGAGPHFCAGAAISRVLVSDIALPMLFDSFQNLRLDEDVKFRGWAFRGPVSVKVRWD